MTPERASRLLAFADTLGYRFASLDLLDQALTHASCGRDSDGPGNNEALEFLGDAVLGFLVAELLHQNDPEGPEGVKTRARNRLVSAAHLAPIADRLGLAGILAVGPSERKGGAVLRKPRLWVNAYEAVLGAVYVDGGIEPVRLLVRKTFEHELAHLDRVAAQDHKTALQEWLQARGRPLPRYEVESEPGQDGSPFRVRCVIEGESRAEGSGSTKKHAQQEAARRALGALVADEGAVAR